MSNSSQLLHLYCFITSSDLQRVFEVSGNQRCHLCRPLWLSHLPQSVWQPALLHGRQLQRPLQTSKTQLTGWIFGDPDSNTFNHFLTYGFPPEKNLSRTCSNVFDLSYVADVSDFCDFSPLRFLSRLRRTAVLLLAGQCCSSLRRMLVMASGFCASWCEPMPGCPLNCWPSFRASGWPVRTIRLSGLSVATWRALASAGLLIRCLCLGQTFRMSYCQAIWCFI